MRLGLIQKIHVAKKQLCLTDESYRDLLRRLTGKDTCTTMNEGQLETVLGEFKRLGFKPTKTSRKAGQRKLADTSQARMIRGMWIELYQLGAVNDPSEKALASYVKRMTGIEDLHWLKTGDKETDIVINGLRSWIRRVKVENERRCN